MENLRQEGSALTAAEKCGCKHQFWHTGIYFCLPGMYCAPTHAIELLKTEGWHNLLGKNNKPKPNMHHAHHGHSGSHFQQKNMCTQIWMCIYI